jgi:hypothetical protein
VIEDERLDLRTRALLLNGRIFAAARNSRHAFSKSWKAYVASDVDGAREMRSASVT